MSKLWLQADPSQARTDIVRALAAGASEAASHAAAVGRTASAPVRKRAFLAVLASLLAALLSQLWNDALIGLDAYGRSLCGVPADDASPTAWRKEDLDTLL